MKTTNCYFDFFDWILLPYKTRLLRFASARRHRGLQNHRVQRVYSGPQGLAFCSGNSDRDTMGMIVLWCCLFENAICYQSFQKNTRDLKHFGRCSAKCCYKMRRPGAGSQRCPPKGALQNAKSWAKIFQKPEFWKQHGSTTKCRAECIFHSWKNGFGRKCMAREDFIRRKYWSKPVFYQTRANVFSRGNSNPDTLVKT